MDVLTRAAKEKGNLIVTSEPTFFGQKDAAIADNWCTGAKKDFLEKNRMVVWRFSGELARPPTQSAPRGPRPNAGMDQPRRGPRRRPFRDDAGHPRRSHRPSRQTPPRTRRHPCGGRSADPYRQHHPASRHDTARCHHESAAHLRSGDRRRSARVGVGGIRPGYSGERTEEGFITIGRVLSEDPGMEVCAQWLKTLVPEAPVRCAFPPAIPIGGPPR